MSLDRRDVGEVEALITDRYLDSILAVNAASDDDLVGGRGASLSAAVRAVSRRLATDMPHFHPAFRFEERLALRLAEVAASMRFPMAAGGESQPSPIRRIEPSTPDPLAVLDDDLADRGDSRPLLIGGAVAASLSLAGAWLAWRRRTSPMARAIRAAHSLRPGRT